MAILIAALFTALVATGSAQYVFSPRATNPTSPDTGGPSMPVLTIAPIPPPAGNSTDSSLPPAPFQPPQDLGSLLMELIGLAKQLSTDLPEGQPPMLPPWRRRVDRIGGAGAGSDGGDQSGGPQQQDVRVYQGRPVDGGQPVGVAQQGSPSEMDGSHDLPDDIRFAMMSQMRGGGNGGMSAGGDRPAHPLAALMAHRMPMMQGFRRGDNGDRDGDDDSDDRRPGGPGRRGRGGRDDNDDDEEGPRGHHGHGRRPPFPRPDDQDDGEEGHSERGHGQRPCRRRFPFPFPRPDFDDDGDMEEQERHRRRPFGPPRDDEDDSGPMRRGGDDDENEDDGPHPWGRRFGGPGGPRFGMFRQARRDDDSDNRDDDNDFRPDFDQRRDRDRDDDDDSKGRGRNDDDDDDSDEEEGRGRPGRHGDGGPGGRRPHRHHHKKPNCRKVIKFLLWKLRHQRGGRGGRWDEGQDGRGPQDGFRLPLRDGDRMSFGGEPDEPEDRNDSRRGFGELRGDDSDSNNDMIFPRRSPFAAFDGDDE